MRVLWRRGHGRRAKDRPVVDELAEAIADFRVGTVDAADHESYRAHHHDAMNRITILEGTLAMVVRDLDAGGALTPATVTLVEQVLP